MALRAILSPSWQRFRFSALALLVALMVSTGGPLAPAPAFGTVLSIEPSPIQPTTCDSVAVVVKGELPDCYSIESTVLKGPVPLPTAGPVPQFAVRVQIAVRNDNPWNENNCTQPPHTYARTLTLPFHPSGQYHAVAIEYVIPFLSTGPSGTDTTRVETTFPVAPDTCRSTSCYRLDFQHPPSQLSLCDGGGAPNDTACVEIALSSFEAVAGVQSTIHVTGLRSDPTALIPGEVLRPVRARAIGRADEFHVAWSSDGSTIKFMLYSNDGAAIPPGMGPVLRVCYAIGPDASGPYFLRFADTVVADPAGAEIPPCPTFGEIVGRFCVGQPPCDVDGNGRSNVLDIIRLVRCALADSTMCPDSVKANADCNDDGTIDIRDIICCVRKMLRFGFSHMDEPNTEITSRIGFSDPVEWITPGHGRVSVTVLPWRSDFGGLSVGIRPAVGTTIRDIHVPDDARYQVDVDLGDPAMARLMMVRLTDTVPPAPLTFTVLFDAAAGGVPEGASIKLVDAQTGSWSGLPARTEVTSASAIVPTGSPAPRVYPARPNPFTNTTDIGYELPAQRHITLRVYSATGKLVRTLVDATVPQGVHRAPWNGRDSAGRVVSSGIYFVKLSDGTAESTIRIMRLK